MRTTKTKKKISHKQLWNLGRHYADYSTPHIVAQAKATNYPLPCRSHTELFPVLRDVYDLLEREHGFPWDSLTTARQDDFLVGFWNRLRENGILEKRVLKG